MATFSWSIDPVACSLGFVAIVLAWKAYRASTKHFLKLVEVDASYGSSVNPRNDGPRLEVTLLNLGLPISRPSVHLYFERQEGPRLNRYMFELSPCLPDENVAFEQGMRASFMCLPRRGRDSESSMAKAMSAISSPRRQKAAIVIKNAGYEVQRIRLHAWTDWLVRKWNEFAHGFNSKHWVEMNDGRGETVVRNHRVLQLSVFKKPSSLALREFSKYWRNEMNQAKEPAEENSPAA